MLEEKISKEIEFKALANMTFIKKEKNYQGSYKRLIITRYMSEQITCFKQYEQIYILTKPYILIISFVYPGVQCFCEF